MNYGAAVAECRERLGKREISDDAAIALCAAWASPGHTGWASPGHTGWALAAVATGAWTGAELAACNDSPDADSRDKLTEFRDDLYRTFGTSEQGSEEMIIWGALATWACNGADQ